MTCRRMRLVAFLLSGPTAHHHGMWRHPETDNSFLTPEYYEHIARVLEGGLFDALFFADILALMDFYKGSYETVLSRGGQMGMLDPIPVLAQMARVTKHIGLGGSVSSSFVHAFQTARTFATMDHLSGGRMAWNIVTTSSSPQWANFGQTPMPRDERYDMADEVVEACTRLWDSWEPDALIIDKASGRFVDASKVHRVNYEGKYVRTRGPLTVPRTKQGWPGPDAGWQFGTRAGLCRAVGRNHLHAAARDSGYAGVPPRHPHTHGAAGPTPRGMPDPGFGGSCCG